MNLISIAEAAAILEVSTRTVYSYILKGLIRKGETQSTVSEEDVRLLKESRYLEEFTRVDSTTVNNLLVRVRRLEKQNEALISLLGARGSQQTLTESQLVGLHALCSRIEKSQNVAITDIQAIALLMIHIDEPGLTKLCELKKDSKAWVVLVKTMRRVIPGLPSFKQFLGDPFMVKTQKMLLLGYDRLKEAIVLRAEIHGDIYSKGVSSLLSDKPSRKILKLLKI